MASCSPDWERCKQYTHTQMDRALRIHRQNLDCGRNSRRVGLFCWSVKSERCSRETSDKDEKGGVRLNM